MSEQLDRLIAAVEAGEIDGRYDPAFERAIYPCEKDMRPVYLAGDAYHGSLDAAKALHDALLPGHTRDVDATAPECGITVSIWSPSGPITGKGDLPCEARAWLLAILRAYREVGR